MSTKPQKNIDLTFQGPPLEAKKNTDVTLEQIFGKIPQVSSVPTWKPKRFLDGFAYYESGATYRFYVYSFTSNAWRFVALT